MAFLTQRPENQALREKQGRRQIEITKFLGLSTASAQNFYATIQNPSRRLSLSLEFFWGALTANSTQAANMQANGVTSFFNYPTTDYVRLFAATEPVDFQPASGVVAVDSGVLHVITLAELPVAYEIDSAVRRIEAQVNVTSPTVSAAAVHIRWYIRARWEPNTPLTDDEWVDLISGCHVAV